MLTKQNIISLKCMACFEQFSFPNFVIIGWRLNPREAKILGSISVNHSLTPQRCKMGSGLMWQHEIWCSVVVCLSCHHEVDKVRSLVLMFVFVSLYVIRNNVEHLCNSNLLLYSVYICTSRSLLQCCTSKCNVVQCRAELLVV